MRYSVLVLVFMLYAGCLPGQSPGKAEWLSVNEGLSQGMIYDILQSRDGFLWIATKDGLNRYDGYRFEIFSPDPFDPFAIAASEVYCLFEDSRGWIWIRLSGKIEIYDPVSGRFFHLTEQVAPGLSKSVGGFSFSELADGALVFTDAGKIWKIAAPAGVLKKAASQGNAFPGLRGAVVEVSERAGISDGPVQFRAVHFTKNKVLLASSNQGLFRLDTAAGQLNLEVFPGLSTHILGESPDGRVWIQAARPGFGDVPGEAEGRLSGSEGPGLWIWKNTSEPPRNVGRPQPYKKCRFDHEGYLWALNDKELRKWRPMAFANGGQPEFEWASDDPLIQSRFLDFQCVAIDRSGIAWVGTTGYGILKANPEKPKFRSYLKGTSQRYLAEDPQGNLICAIDPAQIYPRQNFGQPETNPWLAGLPGKWRNFMPVFDETGNAWGIPEPNVLLRIDARAKTVRQYRWDGAGLSALLFCKNGTLLQASEEGLLQFDPATGQSRDFPFGRPQKLVPDSYYISNLYEDSEGIVWIIGFKGLIKAAPAGGGYRYEYFKTDPSDPSSLSYNTVLSVAEDPLEPRRYLWAGTKSGGLNRLDRQTGKFKHYKKEDGLPDNVVYGVRSDNTGHIWLSTNKGLCRFHVREETTKNFTYADGLQDNEFNSSSYLKMKDGTLVFGGVRGLTIFHPDSLRFNEHKPQTHIVGLKANNRPLSEWTGSRPDIVLSHRRNLLTFEFAALEFTNPAQNLYRYQLIRHSAFGHEGEGRWVDLGARNNVQFANLRPGRYTFRVLGSNNDGAWGQDPAALRFAINPPWWATSRACLLYILCLSAMAWAFYKYQLGRRLERQETMRLRELDDFKNRFFTNITHEFRTPLTVILGMAEQVEPAVDEKLKPKIGLIRRNGQNLLRLINQILDLAKLESHTLKINYVQGDILPYLRYISESLHSVANARNVMLRVESNEASIVMDYDPERLLRIVYNLLSNAIKYTPSGGRVDLRVTVVAPHGAPTAVITVADTGAGIPPEDLPHIFGRFYQGKNPEKAKAGGTGIGLALTKELVQSMGGEIGVESKVGRGTTFTARLPITNNAPPVNEEEGGPALPMGLREAKRESALFPLRGFAAGTGREGPPSSSTPSPAEKEAASRPQLLLIEDNPDVVEYLSTCLASPSFGTGQGGAFALDFAYNGRAGIEKALEAVPDIIISDVMMPEKDGFEVVETLKNDERTSHIPIVLLTARADVESRISGLRRGADAYLAKPFHREELLATLNNLLELRRKLQAKYVRGPEAMASAGESLASEMEEAFLQKVRDIIQEHLSDASFTVEGLSQSLALSPRQLHRKLTALTGRNASALIRSMRLAKAREWLLAGKKNVSEVAYATGFDDPKYFSRVFAKEFGVPPSKV